MPRPTASPAPLLRAARRFHRDEDGILTIFGVGIFVLMMLAGGVALDFMRFEAERAHLQHTLDRAVLAAASLNQERDRRAVIEDYFRAAGLGGYALEVEITESAEHREIVAHSTSPVRSLFLNMLGIDSIAAPASSGAEERIRNVEVSLVLDVSGSMGDDGKIERLRPAAQDFVREMLVGREASTSISIVPYNGKVNVGSQLAGYYQLDDSEHTLSNCARFDAAGDFDTTAIPAGAVLPRLANFDTATDDLNERRGGLRQPHCPHDDTNRILPWSNNVNTLSSFIGGLNAAGWTAIDVGMKWGAALVDPSARGRVNAMIADGLVTDDFEDGPVDFGSRGALKVVVIMTDGENTNQYDLRASRRGDALSPLYAYHEDLKDGGGARTPAAVAAILADRSDTLYSVHFPEMDEYYDWLRDERHDEPLGEGDAVQLTWHEAHSVFGVDYLQDQIVWRQGYRNRKDDDGDDNWVYRYSGTADGEAIPSEDYNFWRIEGDYTFAGNEAADTNLSKVCNAARAAGIVIYTIAYQAKPAGETAMRDCAGASSFYFDVEDLNIAQAFQSIQASIHSLRLTR